MTPIRRNYTDWIREYPYHSCYPFPIINHWLLSDSFA